jgi:hypothetical protein
MKLQENDWILKHVLQFKQEFEVGQDAGSI